MIPDIYTKQVRRNKKQDWLKSDADKLKYMTKNLELVNFMIDKLLLRADILAHQITDFEAKREHLQKLIKNKDFIQFERGFFK